MEHVSQKIVTKDYGAASAEDYSLMDGYGDYGDSEVGPGLAAAKEALESLQEEVGRDVDVAESAPEVQQFLLMVAAVVGSLAALFLFVW